MNELRGSLLSFVYGFLDFGYRKNANSKIANLSRICQIMMFNKNFLLSTLDYNRNVNSKASITPIKNKIINLPIMKEMISKGVKYVK